MTGYDNLKEIKVLKENPRQKITLLQDESGKKYLKKEIEGDKREIYKNLQLIKCDNIPQIYYVGLTDKTVVIEEYIEGCPLSEFRENFTKGEIRHIVLQLVEAIGALHKRGIIHRDIKPDNIMIDENYHIWLIDFDIARIHRGDLRRDTEEMGTFGYAPIEQYGLMPTDFKTDVYAFGATLKVMLERLGKKGYLYNIAQKCTRLDPSQRYKNIDEVKRAIILGNATPIAICLVIVLAVVIISLCLLNKTEKVGNWENMELATKENAPQIEIETPTEIQMEEKQHFAGFEEDDAMIAYSKYPTYNHVAIFSMYEAWDHLLFLEDVNKKGKIKLGKNNTLIDADITLKDGKLSVYLKDDYDHEFSHEFAYTGQYEYNLSNPPDRKNADMVCCDMDYDDIPELLIGLNEGTIGVIEHQFYNNFNYCIGWCIKYDEETGFTLCEGDMFSEEYSFYMTAYTKKFNIEWYNWGDITGYALEDNKIIPVY